MHRTYYWIVTINSAVTKATSCYWLPSGMSELYCSKECKSSLLGVVILIGSPENSKSQENPLINYLRFGKARLFMVKLVKTRIKWKKILIRLNCDFTLWIFLITKTMMSLMNEKYSNARLGWKWNKGWNSQKDLRKLLSWAIGSRRLIRILYCWILIFQALTWKKVKKRRPGYGWYSVIF